MSHLAARDDMVRISMDTFVRRFPPDRYELWLAGKDIGPHPEDPSRNTPANRPTHADVLCNKRYEQLSGPSKGCGRRGYGEEASGLGEWMKDDGVFR